MDRFVDTNGMKLHCIDHLGEEPPVVLLAGLTANANSFDGLVGAGLARQALSQFPSIYGVALDAARIRDLWLRQNGRLFRVGATVLTNDNATPEAILGNLDALTRKVKPDDLIVFYFGGHSWAEGIEDTPRDLTPGSFVLAGPSFDYSRPMATGVTNDRLVRSLENIPCRKLVLINSSNSGDVVLYARQMLGQKERGLVIIADCKPKEEAHEVGRRGEDSGSLLAHSIIAAIGRDFDVADTNKDGQLDCAEFAAYVIKSVSQMAQEYKLQQIPVTYPEVVPPWPLVRKTR